MNDSLWDDAKRTMDGNISDPKIFFDVRKRFLDSFKKINFSKEKFKNTLDIMQPIRQPSYEIQNRQPSYEIQNRQPSYEIPVKSPLRQPPVRLQPIRLQPIRQPPIRQPPIRQTSPIRQSPIRQPPIRQTSPVRQPLPFEIQNRQPPVRTKSPIKKINIQNKRLDIKNKKIGKNSTSPKMTYSTKIKKSQVVRPNLNKRKIKSDENINNVKKKIRIR